MTFIVQINEYKTKIKDLIEDSLSSIRSFTWTSTWTLCPSYLSRQIIAKLAKYLRKHTKIDILSMLRVFILIKIQNIDINIDNMSMYTSLLKTAIKDMIKDTMSFIDCITWPSTWTKCLSSFAKYNMQVDN